ncbi:MAG: cell division protein ZapE [Betaproteobacteria bacterium]|nr:cell division protein ZapE [Betaproteobacteria bacterium]MDH5222698.1 cell division protein ZapE [Betaproteobacteria bacterium]
MYEQSLARRGFVADPSQRRAVERLQRLFEEWGAYKARRNTALKRLLVKPPLPKGVYLWGAVGRGKSFLMDAFYLCVPLVRKRRVHFHHFMREIHRELEGLKGTEDPIAAVAERTARRYRLVCFDEFHVADIADAMILGRYLAQAMERGVQFVMTSNYRPDQLYPNGLQRERFLPAVALLQERLDVLEVDNGIDYRRLKMEKLKVYHCGPGAEAELARIFAELKDVEEESQPLDVEGRKIPYRRRAGGLVWFDFQALCGGPRSYTDYVDLAKRFHTVMLSGIPRMSAKAADAARRFTWLVDVFYDDRVKLAVGAEAPPEELFTEGEQSAEFQRTVSRLHEMQSAQYLASERRRASGEVQGVQVVGSR